MTKFALIVAVTAMASPVLADGHLASGDPEVGETKFNRQCIACHVVADADGNVLAGRTARTGPNLFAIAGRQLGAIDGFRYSDSMVEMGAEGVLWNEANFVSFVQDPTAWMRETLDNGRARSKMAYRVRNEEDALNIYAYLSSLGATSQ